MAVVAVASAFLAFMEREKVFHYGCSIVWKLSRLHEGRRRELDGVWRCIPTGGKRHVTADFLTFEIHRSFVRGRCSICWNL